MSDNTLSQEQVLVGGWSPYHPLTAEEKAIFDEAMKGLLGVVYTPQQVSTQVVAGMNYRYKCLAQMPPAEVVWEAIVEIYKPLKGQPIVTHISRI
ncbi:hypothetical protein [Fluviicola sp.]|uniref:hypothetical protein n=1 Tax=Fluviicola sp. TaxID=1917219 RepID=UPI0031DD779C